MNPLGGTEADMGSDHFSPYRSDGKLYGFVCVVTGSSPITKAIIRELAAHGAACIYACASPGETTFSDLTAQLRTLSPNTSIIPYPHHVTSEESTLTLIDDILNTWGRLDVWVTSSGLLGPPSITSTSPADVQRCFETNALAPFYALKWAPAAMKKTTGKGAYKNAAPKERAYGSLVVISSVAATYGGCWGPALTMSSHAALGCVRSGVAVLKGTGIRINCISPGQIDVGIDLGTSSATTTTDTTRGLTSQQLPPTSALQTPEAHRPIIGLERPGLPEEVARVAGFLASSFSSYMTGSNLVVDGGASTMNPLTVPV